MPFGGGNSADSTVSLRSGAPQAAALAAGSTAAPSLTTRPTPSAAALAEIPAALPPGATDSAPARRRTTRRPHDGRRGSGPGPGPVAPTDPDMPGPVQNTVGAVDDAAGGLGLDLPLNELTDPVTQPVDDTVGGTLNNVGDDVGAGNLGDNVNGTLNGVTGGLLGGN